MGVMDHSALRVLLFCTASHEVVAETLSDALTFLDGADGMALLFDSDEYYADTGFPGSAAIVGGGTQDGYDTSPDTAAASLLTYTSPSVKMVMGPSGTLRFGAHNLYLDSENFTTANWSPGNCTYTVNDIAAPTGAITADKVAVTSTGSFRGPGQSTAKIAGATYEQSVYAKNGDIGWIKFEPDSGNFQAWFDIATGVAGATTGSGVTSGIESVGAGWYRCWIRWTQGTTTTNGDAIRIADANSSQTATAGKFAYLWGAHVRRTPSDSTYLATTSAARYALPFEWDTAGVLQGIRVEEARTNVCLRSQEFDNAAWTKTGAASWTSGISGPAGASAYRFTGGASSVAYEFYQAITIVNAASYTWSIYAKAGTANYIAVYAYDASPNITWFNLSNGTIGTNAAGNTATITSVGSGWYRCTLTRTVSGTSGYFNAAIAIADNSVVAPGSVYIDVYGAQLEAGSFQTSYIPTIGSTVTRASDNISLGTGAFPYSATASTWFAYATNSDVASFYGTNTLIGGQTFNIAEIRVTSSTQVQGVGSGDLFATGTVGSGATTTVKSAFAVASNDFATVSNGGSAATDTSGTPATMTTLYLGSRSGSAIWWNGIIKQLAYYPTRKTNAELQTLTT